MICLHSINLEFFQLFSLKKSEGTIFGEVGWFAGCRTTLVPSEKKWKRQTFQLWDLFSKYFSSEILIERYTRKWKFLHLTKGKSQGVKCQSSQGQQNSFFFLQFWYMTFKFPACTKLWSNTDGQIKSFGQPCPWASSCLPGMGTFKSSQHAALSYLRQQEFG